jgi:hypothetical protein
MKQQEIVKLSANDLKDQIENFTEQLTKMKLTELTKREAQA